MNTTDVPFAVLRFQYQIARIPLQLIEEQMAAWMGSEAPPRVFYERSLGALDATVGNLLGDPKLEKRGAALIEHSDALDRAAQLDATATQQHEQADDELKAKRDNAIKDQKDARAAKERQVKEARTAAEQRKRAAAQDAEKRPPPQSSRPTTWLPSARIRPKRPSAKNRPRLRRPSRQPPRLPSPSSKMLRQHAATLPASAHRRTR